MRSFIKFILSALALVALVIVATQSIGAQPAPVPDPNLVQKDEAVAVADLWYAMELNSGYLKIDETERADRLSRLGECQVLYLVSKDDLLDSPPVEGEVLAYVIKYEPTGFVVVSGDDRIEPIIVFGTDSEFRWDQPERNFLRYFLGKDMVNRREHLETKVSEGTTVEVHPNWSYVRSRLQEGESMGEVSFKAPEGTVYVLWDTAAWGQCDFYNDTVSIHNGNDNCIPTGCTATAMAIKMRFHSWPASGQGSHSYNDTAGSVQFSHSVNFGTQTYDWAAMPTTNLTQANDDVADLMYHCGVAVEMNYEQGCCGTGPGSGAWPSASSMNTHFRYKGTEDKATGHAGPIRDSVRGGLPVVLSSSAHTVVCDGYRDTVSPYYHLNAGHGAGGDWYSLNAMPWGTDPTIDMSYPYSCPRNYIYVDGISRSSPDGTLQNAFETVSQGVSAVPTNGHLWIKAGSYTGAGNVPITIDKAMTIRSYEGTATIGQ